MHLQQRSVVTSDRADNCVEHTASNHCSFNRIEGTAGIPKRGCLRLFLFAPSPPTRQSERTGTSQERHSRSVRDRTFPDAASDGLGSRDQTHDRFPQSHSRAKLVSCKNERQPADIRTNEQTRVFAMKAEMNTSTKRKPIAVRLEFHDDRARNVCIVGTFNDWDPKTTPMVTTGPGQWIKELALSPGIYEYQYVVDGRWINDPHAVKSTPNPFGGRNSVLVVEQTHTKSRTGLNRTISCVNPRRKGGSHDR